MIFKELCRDHYHSLYHDLDPDRLVVQTRIEKHFDRVHTRDAKWWNALNKLSHDKSDKLGSEDDEDDDKTLMVATTN